MDHPWYPSPQNTGEDPDPETPWPSVDSVQSPGDPQSWSFPVSDGDHYNVPSYPMNEQRNIYQPEASQFSHHGQEQRMAAINPNLEDFDPPEHVSTPPPAAQKREFACPVYEADILLDRRHSCRGTKAESMAHVRRHLKQGRKPHVKFLELCRTCCKHFLDKREFETYHGKDGEFCDNHHPQSRGKQVEEEWYSLYRMLSPMARVPLSPYVPLERSSQSTLDLRTLSVSLAETTTVTAPNIYTPIWDQATGPESNARASHHPHNLSQTYPSPYEMMFQPDNHRPPTFTPHLLSPASDQNAHSEGIRNYALPGDQPDPFPKYATSVEDFITPDPTQPSTLLSADNPLSPSQPYPSSASDPASSYSLTCKLCGKILRGEHAASNLRRHQNSEACRARSENSDEGDVDTKNYICPACRKRYRRSDGLGVHMRKRHGVAKGTGKRPLEM
ncbi:hypothetical protein BCR34DRAFT_239481 [Clohesyomyces aquaticus]|uniref:C2H2-type domain-containing protein n=1 Tax=Clohesyomyces aquaticus TaxID=1231657 RepID=A0A1Y1Y6W1_9PLEO|nr:hypothetical protein BCR34DRAFT_239481 [Clohesyomyces aquaticus]